jgi:DME family drug/metabolite transporter
VFAVHLFRLGVPPASVALLRPLLGVALLGTAVAIARREALRLDTRGLLVVGLGGGAAVAVFQIAYQLSIDAAGVPTTVALLYLAPPIVTVASGPLIGEWPSARRIALVAVVVGGVWMTVLGAGVGAPSPLGGARLAWGAIAAAAYASYTLFGRYAAPRFGSIATTVHSTAGACVLLTLFLAVAPVPLVLPRTPGAWALLAAFAALTIALAQLLFFDALRRVEASGVSVATSVEPVVAALLATTLLDQGLTPVGWVGVALVVTGVAGVAGSTRSGTRARPRLLRRERS